MIKKKNLWWTEYMNSPKQFFFWVGEEKNNKRCKKLFYIYVYKSFFLYFKMFSLDWKIKFFKSEQCFICSKIYIFFFQSDNIIKNLLGCCCLWPTVVFQDVSIPFPFFTEQRHSRACDLYQQSHVRSHDGRN